MIKNKKVLALIPARGGSKGIRNKNIYPIFGKPLISYSIIAAQESRYIDRILVSTDSLKISEVARQYGDIVPFIRPSEYAKDNSKSIDVVMHALKWLKEQSDFYDILLLLQPTQPLRTSDDIDKSLEIYIKHDEQPLASVCEVDDHPLLIRTIEDNGNLKSLLSLNSTVRRQDMMPFYKINGCIYINRIKDICAETSFNDNKIPYIMPKERSVDIDELSDIVLAQYYLKK